MDLSDFELELLIRKLFKGTITPEEQNKIDSWLNHKMGLNYFEVDPQYGTDEKEIKDKILNKILLGIRDKPRNVRITRLKYVAAVAACIVFIFLGLFFHTTITNDEDKYQGEIIASQVLPASQNAILIEPNGNTIALKSGVGSVLIKDNRILYVGDSDSSLVSKHNNKPGNYIIQTPKGGYYTITLNDGSRVWLNADSRIEYPLEFNQKTRVVSLAGEAYFEISRDVNRPFYVKTKGQTIRVLGTEFNVSAYGQESLTRTTLVNGKVSVFPGNSANSVEYFLNPGFQAVNDGNGIKIAKKNVAAATAWKSGLFYFDGIAAKYALQELGRWYNLSVEIKGDISEVPFYGVIERNKPLQAILDVLEDTGVKFEVTRVGDEKKLIVY